MEIRYLQEKNFSINECSKMIDDEKLIDHHIRKAIEVLGASDILFALNNMNVNKIPNNCTQLPVICNGLNKFQHFNKIFFGAALNRTPSEIRMLKDFGVSQEIINESLVCEIAYQNIMRTSLRDIDSKEIVQIVCVDRNTAEFIAKLFKGCSLGPIDGVLKKVTVTKVESKCKGRLQMLIDSKILNSNTDDTLKVTMIKNINSNIAPECNFKTNVTDFISTIKSFQANNIISEKEDYLFTGTVFDNSGQRKLENVKYNTFLIMDIDNGDLTPEDFHRIFKNVGYCHVVINSFNHNPSEGIYKYRAIFFTDKNMTVDDHNIIFNYILNILMENKYYTQKIGESDSSFKERLAKYNGKSSGVDLSKQNLTSIFFCPCNNKNINNKFLYKAFNKTREVESHLLNVQQIIEHSQIEMEDVRLVEHNIVHTVSMDNVLKMVDKLVPHNRSVYAQSIARSIMDFDIIEKNMVFQLVVQKGIDKNAQKSFRKYARI